MLSGPALAAWAGTAGAALVQLFPRIGVAGVFGVLRGLAG